MPRAAAKQLRPGRQRCTPVDAPDVERLPVHADDGGILDRHRLQDLIHGRRARQLWHGGVDVAYHRQRARLAIDARVRRRKVLQGTPRSSEHRPRSLAGQLRLCFRGADAQGGPFPVC